jgi:hypothetical protein
LPSLSHQGQAISKTAAEDGVFRCVASIDGTLTSARDGREVRTAEPFVSLLVVRVVGQHSDAIGLEGIEAVFDLAQTGVGIAKLSEAVGVIRSELRRILIAVAGQAPSD